MSISHMTPALNILDENNFINLTFNTNFKMLKSVSSETDYISLKI